MINGLFDFCTIRMQHVRLGIGAAEQDAVFDWFVWESGIVQGIGPTKVGAYLTLSAFAS